MIILHIAGQYMRMKDARQECASFQCDLARMTTTIARSGVHHPAPAPDPVIAQLVERLANERHWRLAKIEALIRDA
ncbi:hypothetical protein LOS78_01190 [Paracoccus sp. MA]|uniref:hypothetical protein n=1 Tax=Paracoccus sp. MA TaxID=2895796 RepID=UPI001E36655C|nr:hypothetical protein [Paracoccus sp. MA]UFM64122.1 hypothetical protein LOS78_01190 [Paracoccus sp. MA]